MMKVLQHSLAYDVCVVGLSNRRVTTLKMHANGRDLDIPDFVVFVFYTVQQISNFHHECS